MRVFRWKRQKFFVAVHSFFYKSSRCLSVRPKLPLFGSQNTTTRPTALALNPVQCPYISIVRKSLHNRNTWILERVESKCGRAPRPRPRLTFEHPKDDAIIYNQLCGFWRDYLYITSRWKVGTGKVFLRPNRKVYKIQNTVESCFDVEFMKDFCDNFASSIFSIILSPCCI